jgi:hypothetical protein
LCPFCRAEIKGFESVVINPFDNLSIQNKKESDSNECDDQYLQTLAIDHTINNGASSVSDNISSIPPPIPPRPVNMKLNTKPNLPQRFQQNIPPPLHNNDVLLLPQRSSRPLSSISSNDSLSDSLSKNNKKRFLFIFNLF